MNWNPVPRNSSKTSVSEIQPRIGEEVAVQLKIALARSEADFGSDDSPIFQLSPRMTAALAELSLKAEKASAGFTNIVTALAIKAARPSIDVRYHQSQIQSQTPNPAGFNFRGLSETVVYPWLSQNDFQGAKSGWQTRTLERPKPYRMEYDENILDIKDSFLTMYDELEEFGADPAEALRYIVYKQIQFRAAKQITIAEPKTNEIVLIMSMLEEHFMYEYTAKGASRLPVLAFHAIYSVLVKELHRFKGKLLKPLEPHSAADSQTGALGDIEVSNEDGTIFEALEIKHNMQITAKVVEDVKRKVMDKSVSRYYVLTTHSAAIDPALNEELRQIQARFGCQVILNGVLPSLFYYLRLLAEPAEFFPEYADLLKKDKAISFQHRETWNRIAVG